MNLAELAQAGRNPPLPLTVELPNGEVLQLQTWLRVLPGQRYVAKALWRGQEVLAKLLVGAKAQRQFARECEGAGLLVKQQLPTAQLHQADYQQGQGGWLLFEFLAKAQSLADAWQAVADQPLLSAAQHEVLAQALGAIARLHGQGLWQADLHLDNVLKQDDQLYWIDGGAVQGEQPGQPLSRAKVLENLGVFFAQLPAAVDEHLEELLIFYLLENAEHALPLEALQQQIAKVRRWRLRDYLNKAGRECSLFAAKVGAFGLKVVRRSELKPLEPLLVDLDMAVAGGHIYKTGGAATVAKVELNQRPLVIKRYNIKNPAHWLKRCWRPSRAWHSWQQAHRLEQLGIATPKALAVVEQRWLWLRGTAWLITEFCPGQDILARWQPHLQGPPPQHELEALLKLFAALRRECISHGDFKGHNLFWDEARGRWSMIDLDAMQAHRWQWRFEKFYARDRARFLRNWPAESPLHQLLDEQLPKRSD